MTQATLDSRPATLGRATVVIGGDDIYEDLFGVGLQVQRLLSRLGFATTQRMGMAWLDDPATPSLVVLYTAMAPLTPAQMTRLEQLVSTGAGLLVLHTTNVFPNGDDGPRAPHDRAFALYGSRYVSHGPQPHSSRFTVELDPEHPVTAGLWAFAIDHEHYALETTSDVRVIAWRAAGHGREPIAHVREQGSGRILYLQLGHDTRPFAEPGVIALIERAAHWLAAEVDPKGQY